MVSLSFHPDGHYSAKLNALLPFHFSLTLLSSQVSEEANLSLK